MELLKQTDLMNIIDYEKVREKYRKDIIDYKKERRLSLGPNITITFENRKTMKFQIQEMMRAERMVHDRQIKEELDIYNSLLPEKNGLSATLFIEVTKETQIHSVLNKFIGLTVGNNLYFQIGEQKVFARFEEGREETGKISSVHYLQFDLDEKNITDFLNDGIAVAITIDYNDYQYSEILTKTMRSSLIEDLTL
ncbi:uncharacterized protein METZ01_LOCUS274866 [marine metagenome]|jgi:hypothetical protein|uniref:DUF3501 domain-containing protein n=1 Tax=marine metagenome TaxID=408172 RepID=A0A382KF74_9ZZZZ